MMKEMAIDPSCINNWIKLKSITQLTGPENQILISKFPRKWKKLVFESLDNEIKNKTESKEFLSIVEKLSNIVYLSKAREWENGLDPDKQKNWLKNSLNNHEKIPFHVILSLLDHDSKVVANPEYFDSKNKSSPFFVENSPIIERNEDELVNYSKWYLENAEKIIFIDRNFSWVPRFYNPLKRFIKCIAERVNKRAVSQLEYHITDKAGVDEYLISKREEIFDILFKEIKLDCNIKFVRREMDELHPRFIMTDLGIINIENGLDIDRGGGTSRTLVNYYRNDWESQWDDFSTFSLRNPEAIILSISGN